MGRSTTWNNNNASKGTRLTSSAVLNIGRSATLNNNKASKGTSNAEFNMGISATWNNNNASKGTSSAEFNLGRSATWNNDKASKGTSSGIDRISNLPGPLITRILSLLPTKCAVATSVLSTKWRFSWTSITNLDFNDSGCYPKKALNMKKIEFTKFVNRVLLLLNPPCIQNFRLKCRQELSDPFYLQSWICAAIGRTVGELVLAFDLKSDELMELPFSRMHCKAVVLKLKGDIYFNIPAQASICFPNLQKLHLSKIKIEIAQNSVVSFPNLKILHLSDVDYENENSAHKLFSSCPILDDLVIKRDTWDNVHCLIICIPSLIRLELDYQFSDDHVDTLQMDKLHSLKSLIILGHALKVVRTASSNISSGFHNLTQLELEKEDCSDWSAVIKDLLGNMDNLEHLTMKGRHCYKNHDQSWWTEPCNVPTCLLSRVTTISFDYMISDCCDELEMLRYFLNNAEVLELLTINTKGSDPEEKLELVEKVHGWPHLDAGDISKGSLCFCEKFKTVSGYALKGHGCRCGDHSWWTEPCNVPKCLLSRVTTISLSYRINVLCDKLEMLRYFLKNAEALELLTIANYYNPGEKLKLVEMISMFPRGSRTCQVAFA